MQTCWREGNRHRKRCRSVTRSRQDSWCAAKKLIDGMAQDILQLEMDELTPVLCNPSQEDQGLSTSTSKKFGSVRSGKKTRKLEHELRNGKEEKSIGLLLYMNTK